MKRFDMGPVTSALGVTEVSAAVLSLCAKAEPDYADAFTLQAPRRRLRDG